MNSSDANDSNSANPGQDATRLVYVLPQEAVYDRERDSVDLLELWLALWDQKWRVLGTAFVLAIAGAVYSLLATEWWRAEVLLAPAEREAGSLPSSQLGGFSGLASLARLDVGDQKSVKTLAVFRSRDFLREFIVDHELMPVLYPELWDSSTKSWQVEKQEEVPDLREAVTFFQTGIRFIEEDPGTGLVTLAVEWTDPHLAAHWASLLVERINQRMRARTLEEAERNLEYLREQLQGATLATMRQSLGALLESELQQAMVARGQQEFAYEVIDGPEVPLTRERPVRSLIVILAGILGGLVAVLAILGRQLVSRRRPGDQS